MRQNVVVGLIAILATLGCSLSRNVQLRTGTGPRLELPTSLAALDSPAEQRKVAEAAVERHPNFSLGFIEFSDEGLAWSRTQRTNVLALLKRGNVRPAGAVIVVFVHGWKHNSTVCDDNVACFRNVLAGLAAAENAQPEVSRRDVIGIYLGWRGLSYCREPARTLSVWSRKRVGERLGQSQGREVIREVLRAYADLKSAGSSRTRLIVAGHSLGAGVVFSAFGSLMRQALSDVIAERKDTTLEIIDHAGDVPLPDLVVLANPAFEAELYKRIATDLRKIERERLHFAETQLPLLLTVSSETDRATRWIFPPAQFIRYALSPFEWTRGFPFLRRSLVGAGNYDAFVTDRLDGLPTSPSGNAVAEKPTDGKKPSSCFEGDWASTTGFGCSCAELDGPVQLAASAAAGCAGSIDPSGRNVKTCGGVQLTHLRPNLDMANPFIVATAGRTVIDGHNDIYNRRFVSFLIAYLGEVDRRRD